MCGIFALSGSRDNAGTAVLQGLKKLEYRGYDSWGVCVRTTDTGEFALTKQVGMIENPDQTFPAGHEAIGHSRWATHGGVTKANAHPHRAGKVTLVHNGIFENYLTYRTQLSGYPFKSETDTEVLAALIDHYLKQELTPQEAIRQATAKVEGRFAILVMIDGIEGIYAARRGSPLIIGRGKGETFIASDIPAFLAETNTVNYLDDEEMVFVLGDRVSFLSLTTGEPIEKRNITVPWKVEAAEKGDYPHFMLKEIFEQKETITRAINHDDAELERAVELLKSTNGSYFLACGTTHKVTMAAEYFFAEISGRKINVVPASEMQYFQRFVHDRTALVAVSQSGETADVLAPLEQGQRHGAKLLAITNVESSTMARMADVHLPIQAGPEKAVASTKATTAQMALLFLLAHTDAGKTNVGRDILRTTAANINDMINPRYEDRIRTVAESIADHEKLFIIGRGALYPMALEASIKIQEVSYIHAQGFAAGELKHGPLALVEEGTVCIVLGDDLPTLSNATELKARGAHIIGIAPTKADIFDQWLRVPGCGSAQAIATIIPVQILAYHLSVLRGINPDMPRNLAKSVTVR